MTLLASALKELYGLFVGDGALALAICVWLLIAWFGLPHIIANESARPIVVFIGLAVLLADSVRRGALLHGRS